MHGCFFKHENATIAHEMAGLAETVEDLNNLMRLMMKSGLERMLNTEMEFHLEHPSIAGEGQETMDPPAVEADDPTDLDGRSKQTNRRNGHSKKTVKADMGEVTLATPRDRNGTFDPQLIEKYQRRVPGFDEKTLVLHAKGMTTRDIQEIVRGLISNRLESRTSTPEH